MRSQKLKDYNEWLIYRKTKRPKNIPTAPDYIYRIFILIKNYYWFNHISGALGQTRTGTPQAARILSPLCLPISPRGLLDFALLYLYSFITQLVKRKQINLVYDYNRRVKKLFIYIEISY